ncbi:uncharacterized protein [Arachis hypogaea]|uniref:uncharacterized protein n=1 Tax=Arachis hypogaea TaxID=3818 RepID=UPI003B20DE39
MDEHVEDDEQEFPSLYDGPSRVARDFNDLVADGEQELYIGCSKYSKLSFLVKLYHIKCMCSVSDKTISTIQDLLRDAFDHAKLLRTFYEAKKTIRKLGIEYKKTDDCPNDCMLYRGDDEDLTKCKQCGTSRWKQKARKGNDIDIYLQPLVDELKQLWDGVKTYDANTKCTFKMFVALMWTVRFDGQVENRDSPKILFGTDILRQQSNVHVSFGKMINMIGQIRCNGEDANQCDSNWKKSVFFDLPYWKESILCHNLDVMHIEKNVCNNVVFTILNDSEKSKDNLKAQKDLQCMGIRLELWPHDGEKYSSAIFTMSNSQKDIFLKTLQKVVFPDSYSSNIMHCVDLRQRKLTGLKSHDCHILMEHLLPILVKNALLAPVARSWYLGRMKQYARNRDHAEGSIAEGYLSEEILTFFSRYLDNIETKMNRPVRVNDQPNGVISNACEIMFPKVGKALGAATHFKLNQMERHQAHHHVLVNCEAVSEFID